MPDQTAIQRGRDFEKTVADKLDGKLQPGSGNKFYAKNDVIAHGLSISCKSQTVYTWNSIRGYLYQSFEDAQGTGNIPVLALNEIHNEDLIVMRLSDLAKAFAEGIKISEVSESKGIQKRKEIDVPLMLR